MGSFRFHLVTVIGIFLALALGIFIGSATSDEPIIRQQRDMIQSLEEKNYDLSTSLSQLQQEMEESALLLTAHRQLAEILSDAHWHFNPVDKLAMLVHGPGFSPQLLGCYLLNNVVQSTVAIGDMADIEALTLAFLSGDFAGLPLSISGSPTLPDLVLVALGPREQWGATLEPLLNTVTARDIPVVVLGKEDWGMFSDLSSHPLFASVSHIDTPFGLYCLGEILRGEYGHFGPDRLLPGGEE